MVTRDDYKISEKPTWCPGCGNYGILSALTRAFVEHGIAPHEVIVVTGIGCGSKLPSTCGSTACTRFTGDLRRLPRELNWRTIRCGWSWCMGMVTATERDWATLRMRPAAIPASPSWSRTTRSTG
jgi:hypothetical protein